jgi:hypothetical protein
MPMRLTESQTKSLLFELCVRLGFCLPPEDQRRIEGDPPVTVEAFADAVYAAEGMDPQGHPGIRKQVCDCIAAHFAKAAGSGDGEASNMSDVTINLDVETALVLFACLARWDHDEQPLELRDAAEEYAMLQVVARLEKTLVEPFRPNYGALLDAARAALARRAGAS